MQQNSQDSIEIGRQEQENLIKMVTTMNEVAKKLKQIPELPSEKPTDSHPLTKVEFPDEEGVLTYMDGYDYPYRGYPYYEFVDKIDLIKKLSRSLQSGFYHGLKGKWFRWLLIPLVPTVGRAVFYGCAYTFSRLIDRFQMRTNRYSQFVGELYRSFSVSWGDESPQITELRKMIRNVECMILEFDNAYRFRAQDLLPELNKDNLRNNPIKEINRLLDIWISREVSEDVKNSWILLKLFVTYFLKHDKPLLQLFVRVLLELDIDKCKLTIEDKYYAIPRVDYHFGFVENPTIDDAKLIAKVKLQKNYDLAVSEIRTKSTQDHDFLKEKHKKEQANLPADADKAQKIIDQQQLLKTRLQMVQQQNQKEYEKAEKDMIDENLTEEQKEMLKNQQQEISQLDNKYEAQLNETKETYLKEKASL